MEGRLRLKGKKEEIDGEAEDALREVSLLNGFCPPNAICPSGPEVERPTCRIYPCTHIYIYTLKYIPSLYIYYISIGSYFNPC